MTGPALQAHGRRALARLGARLAFGYLLSAAAGVAAARGSGPSPWWSGLPVAGQLVVLGGLISLVLNRSVAPVAETPSHSASARAMAWKVALRLSAVGAGLGALACLIAAGPELGWSRTHALVGWLVPGVGLGLGLAAGPGWGLGGFVALGAGFAWWTPDEAAGAVPATLGGAAVSVVVGAFLNVAARRGFGTTEAAIRAAEAADAARRRAEQRLLARRRLDRRLHDTLLATLTLLAHRGYGVPPDQLRADCRRDLQALRNGDWLDDDQLASASSGSSLASPGVRQVRQQAASITERLHHVRELAARRGLDLRVHVAAERHRTGPMVADPAALAAWESAVTECVSNISRHAGVSAADVVVGCTESALVTLILDEGAGFEASAVHAERLGLSGSVHERLHDVGGQARVWSRPGEGTVVELVLPSPERGTRPNTSGDVSEPGAIR